MEPDVPVVSFRNEETALDTLSCVAVTDDFIENEVSRPEENSKEAPSQDEGFEPESIITSVEKANTDDGVIRDKTDERSGQTHELTDDDGSKRAEAEKEVQTTGSKLKRFKKRLTHMIPKSHKSMEMNNSSLSSFASSTHDGKSHKSEESTSSSLKCEEVFVDEDGAVEAPLIQESYLSFVTSLCDGQAVEAGLYSGSLKGTESSSSDLRQESVSSHNVTASMATAVSTESVNVSVESDKGAAKKKKRRLKKLMKQLNRNISSISLTNHTGKEKDKDTTSTHLSREEEDEKETGSLKKDLTVRIESCSKQEDDEKVNQRMIDTSGNAFLMSKLSPKNYVLNEENSVASSESTSSLSRIDELAAYDNGFNFMACDVLCSPREEWEQGFGFLEIGSSYNDETLNSEFDGMREEGTLLSDYDETVEEEEEEEDTLLSDESENDQRETYLSENGDAYEATLVPKNLEKTKSNDKEPAAPCNEEPVPSYSEIDESASSDEYEESVNSDDSVRSASEDTLISVQGAISTIKKHARRLGISENELIRAVGNNSPTNVPVGSDIYYESREDVDTTASPASDIRA